MYLLAVFNYWFSSKVRNKIKYRQLKQEHGTETELKEYSRQNLSSFFLSRSTTIFSLSLLSQKCLDFHWLCAINMAKLLQLAHMERICRQNSQHHPNRNLCNRTYLRVDQKTRLVRLVLCSFSSYFTIKLFKQCFKYEL
jgi:hypothetical protein